MATRTRMEMILVDGKLLSSRSTTDVSRYEHDCDACIFMGHFGDYDLYFCPSDKSLIGRYGPEGNYKSMTLKTYVMLASSSRVGDDDPCNEVFKRLKDMDIY